jgi:hypothetical protein
MRRDDSNAPWTSYGYTAEGFAKPEVGGSWSLDDLGAFPDRARS